MMSALDALFIIAAKLKFNNATKIGFITVMVYRDDIMQADWEHMINTEDLSQMIHIENF